MNERDADDAASYGDNCAEFYDQIYPNINFQIVRTLARFAAGGRALELGIGTGRVALPLRGLGVDVCGIEASSAMLKRLLSKPGVEDLLVATGNFAKPLLAGPFKLVYAMVSTFYLLNSPEEQQQCFQSVASVLQADGVFLLENYDPPEAHPSVVDEAVFSFSRSLATAQGVRQYRTRICYVSPSRLDEMASAAGMKLRERWANWSQVSYTNREPHHISIYELA